MLQGSNEAIGPDGLGFDEMVSVSEILILAGSETVATALSGMLYYLLKKPSCLIRLTQEIRSSFQNENEINIGSAAPLRYLNAVLEELMRFYPPVPSTTHGSRTRADHMRQICSRWYLCRVASLLVLPLRTELL